MSKQKPKRSRGGAWMTWITVIVLSGAVYVLSIGPVLAVAAKVSGKGGMERVAVVYQPAEALLHQTSALRQFRYDYFTFWFRIMQPGTLPPA